MISITRSMARHSAKRSRSLPVTRSILSRRGLLDSAHTFLIYSHANGFSLDYTRWTEYPVNTPLLMAESTIIVIVTITDEPRDFSPAEYVTIQVGKDGKLERYRRVRTPALLSSYN